MVGKLLEQVVENEKDEWQAEEGPCNIHSFVNLRRGKRVHIFQRGEREELAILDSDDVGGFCTNSRELQPNVLFTDFWKAMSVANLHADCPKFSMQNTVLVAFEKERHWLPDNVLSVERWEHNEDGEYMKAIEDRITLLFETQPAQIKSWLKPRVQYYIV